MNAYFSFFQHIDYDPVHTDRPGELIAYYKIARKDCFSFFLSIHMASTSFCSYTFGFLRSLQMGIG